MFVIHILWMFLCFCHFVYFILNVILFFVHLLSNKHAQNTWLSLNGHRRKKKERRKTKLSDWKKDSLVFGNFLWALFHYELLSSCMTTTTHPCCWFFSIFLKNTFIKSIWESGLNCVKLPQSTAKHMRKSIYVNWREFIRFSFFSPFNLVFFSC